MKITNRLQQKFRLNIEDIRRGDSGFIAILPVMLVASFVLFVSVLTTSNTYTYIQGKILRMNRGIALQSAAHCAIWLQNYLEEIAKARAVNPAVASADSLVVGIEHAYSSCRFENGNIAKSQGLYSGVNFYQNFSFPLTDLYLGSI